MWEGGDSGEGDDSGRVVIVGRVVMVGRVGSIEGVEDELVSLVATPNIHCLIILSLSLQIARHILEAHSSMLNMSLMDAKMQYIRNWQALSDFGITYFVVRVGRSRKDVSDC